MKKKYFSSSFVFAYDCPRLPKDKEVVNEYNIVPKPNQILPQEGRFELNSKVCLVVPSDAPESKKHCRQPGRTTKTDSRNLVERGRKCRWKISNLLCCTRRYAEGRI